jgi:hypothetical protein
MLCLTYFVSLCDTSFLFVSFFHFSFRFAVFRFVSFSFLSLVHRHLFLLIFFYLDTIYIVSR